MNAPAVPLLLAQLRPLVEREGRSRGALLLPLALAVCAAAVAAFQIRIQQQFMAGQWNALPLARDPAAVVTAWLGVAVAGHTVVSRADEDRESAWIAVLHSHGTRAWSYAAAVWSVALLRSWLVIILGFAAIEVARSILAPPEWAAVLEPRQIAGSMLLSANFGALALVSVCLARGATRAAGAAVLLVVVPLAIILAAAMMDVHMPRVAAWIIAGHVPQLRTTGRLALMVYQLLHTAVLLSLALALAKSRLTRRT